MARPLQLGLLQFRNAQLSIIVWLEFRKENHVWVWCGGFLIFILLFTNARTDNVEIRRNNITRNGRVLTVSKLGW